MASINVGWFITSHGIKSCIKDAMDESWERYRPEFVMPTEKWPKEFYDRATPYFTTAEVQSR